ncbi:hypothetical protein [Rhodococcus qingshengii]|uniref:hypothetical protein n=1 Tax=Rhodococcus qingshengii TaxID=334542 RepID=UPI001BE5C059|nr:hypothetical protein [Rhodococcus qingshengii]MBT2275679.1 hypothetical protein [Rhodococcus qingshengii]
MSTTSTASSPLRADTETATVGRILTSLHDIHQQAPRKITLDTRSSPSTGDRRIEEEGVAVYGIDEGGGVAAFAEALGARVAPSLSQRSLQGRGGQI